MTFILYKECESNLFNDFQYSNGLLNIFLRKLLIMKEEKEVTINLSIFGVCNSKNII